ncbi:MAG: PrsW family intramembrane metalloprotease [Dehalococcoidia bacterium]|nr:PrsW family intramembrane metalloprotease [Dehalococcoidia bacterium]
MARYAIGGAVGCSGFICLLLVAAIVVATVPDLVGLPLSVAAAVLPAMVFVPAVIWLDRYERESVRMLLGAFFWGAVVAIVIALILEVAGTYVAGALLGSDGAPVAITVLGAPLIEEMSKGLALLILFFLLKGEFDDALDGIIYGSVVGLGFAMTENMVYFGQRFMEAGVGGLAELFVLRVVLAGLGHALYTGTTGAGLGYAREITNRGLKVVIPMAAFGLGFVQHLLWNGTLEAIGRLVPSSDSFSGIVPLVALMSVVLSGPAILVLLTIVFFTWRRERRIIATFLAGEVSSGVVLAEDITALVSSRHRARATYSALFRRGIGYWYQLRRLHNTEVKLAFAKRHASQVDRTRRRPILEAEDVLRSRIVEIRARLWEL